MKRLIRLGFSIIILAAAVLVPGSSEAAACPPLDQCQELMDCSQYACPQGSFPIVRCTGNPCYVFCKCIICTTCG